MAIPKEVVVDDKKDGICQAMAEFVRVNAIEDSVRINLPAPRHKSRHPDVVLGHCCRDPEQGRNCAGHWYLKSLRGSSIPKNMEMHRNIQLGMSGYKHIEQCVGNYIGEHYTRAVEVGIGSNIVAAEILQDRGSLLRCTDIRMPKEPAGIPFAIDDVFSPELDLYTGADVIYAIRPAVEMIPPLIALAKAIGCRLIVYHLGYESYGDGGEIIDCGVLLHRYR